MSNLFTWQVHGDGKTLKPGEVVELSLIHI